MLPVVVMLAEILPLLNRVSNVELKSAVANLAAIEVVTVFAKNWSSPIAAANSFNVFNVDGALSTTSLNLLLIIVLTLVPLIVIVLATRLGTVTVSLVIVNVPDGAKSVIKLITSSEAIALENVIVLPDAVNEVPGSCITPFSDTSRLFWLVIE